eukprot:2482303-Rhodomonas_salina.1
MCIRDSSFPPSLSGSDTAVRAPGSPPYPISVPHYRNVLGEGRGRGRGEVSRRERGRACVESGRRRRGEREWKEKRGGADRGGGRRDREEGEGKK